MLCSRAVDPGDCAGANGKVCLIQRGSITFAAKVQECQNQNGTAAIIYNNVPGLFSGTLNGASTSIPSVSMSDTDGATLVSMIGTSATVSTFTGNYAFFERWHFHGDAACVWRGGYGVEQLPCLHQPEYS